MRGLCQSFCPAFFKKRVGAGNARELKKSLKGAIHMLEKITQILRDYKGEDDLAVTEASTFEELELDSLDLVQLVMDIEEAFECTIKLDAPITTVKELMGIIENAKE
jgi:acyl carrier protein